MSAPAGYVGIDVAKAHLDAASRPMARHWRVPNTEAGIADLAAELGRSART